MNTLGKALVVIPTFNERESLTGIVQRLLKSQEDISVLIIDDNSPDGTGIAAEQLARESANRVWVIHRSAKLGLGSAYIKGFQWGLSREFELFLEMDADGSHDPASVSSLLGAAVSADVVIGSRYLNGVRVLDWPMRRLLLSYLSNIFTRWSTGLPLTDCTSGFKCFHRRVLEQIRLDKIVTTSYDFQVEMNTLSMWHGFTFKEVPITFSNRIYGISKLSKADVLKAIIAVMRLGWQRIWMRCRKRK